MFLLLLAHVLIELLFGTGVSCSWLTCWLCYCLGQVWVALGSRVDCAVVWDRCELLLAHVLIELLFGTVRVALGSRVDWGVVWDRCELLLTHVFIGLLFGTLLCCCLGQVWVTLDSRVDCLCLGHVHFAVIWIIAQFL